VNSGVWDQVSLELVDIDVQRTLESKRASQTRNDLGNASVEIGVVGLLNLERLLSDRVDSLVIEHERDISVLQKSVGRQNAVVRLNDSSGNLRRGIDAKVHLHLLSVVNAKSLQEKSSESRSGSSSD